MGVGIRAQYQARQAQEQVASDPDRVVHGEHRPPKGDPPGGLPIAMAPLQLLFLGLGGRLQGLGRHGCGAGPPIRGLLAVPNGAGHPGFSKPCCSRSQDLDWGRFVASPGSGWAEEPWLGFLFCGRCCTLQLADYTLPKEGVVDIDGGIAIGCAGESRELAIRLHLPICHLSISGDACRRRSAVVNAACLDPSVSDRSRAWLEDGFGADRMAASGESLG